MGRDPSTSQDFKDRHDPLCNSSRSVWTLVRLFEKHQTFTRVCARDVTFAPGDRGPINVATVQVQFNPDAGGGGGPGSDGHNVLKTGL